MPQSGIVERKTAAYTRYGGKKNVDVKTSAKIRIVHGEQEVRKK